MINKWKKQLIIMRYRSSHPEVFLGKCVLKICNRFTGEHPCRSTISIKLLHNFFEIALRHGCSSVNLLHIFRAPFPKNTSGRLLISIVKVKIVMHVFNFLHDVMLKGDGLLRIIFRKRFEEKYKHTKVALNFVIRQCFS